MNLLIKSSAFALMIVATGYHAAKADPVNININGNLLASPCVVNNNNNNLNVDLGQTIKAETLSTAGAGTTPKAFNLSLTSCPVGTNSVTVTFTGTAAEFPQTNMYMNTGTATNLAVNLISSEFGRDLAKGSSLIIPVNPDRTVTIPLIARAVTATGNVMPGSIIAVIQANITYN